MGIIIHPVKLDADKCKGCITCMKRCPTEAIRVRNGKASVIYDRCIGCGECVRLCPHNAKIPLYDDFSIINDYKYKIALPAPSLYGQFNNLTDVNYVIEGLKKIGFDDVFEVGRAAELCSLATRKMIASGKMKKPVISTACPAVVDLISKKFCNLKENILPVLAPCDIAGKLARSKAEKSGIPSEDIGVFFISPCPAKVAAIKSSGTVKKPYIDGVFACSEVYMKLLPEMNKLSDVPPASKMGIMGLNWASSGGEAVSAVDSKYLAADGIENVMNILNSIENNTLCDIEFIELNACTGGCVGGVLNVENPFVAKARLRELRSSFPMVANSLERERKSLDFYLFEKTPVFDDDDNIENDFTESMSRIIESETILEKLPLNDCGLCGAPSCSAFADDIVSGRIDRNIKCPRLEENENDGK